MKKYFILFVVLTILFACNTTKPKNFILLIDLSDSRDSAVIEWYKKTAIESVFQHVGPKDKITVLPIDRNSELWSEGLYEYDFSKHSYENQYAGVQAEEVAHVNLDDTISNAILSFNARLDIARIQRMRFNTATDISGALSQAVKYTISGYENLLIIFSDMMHSNIVGIDFEKQLNSNEDIEAIMPAIKTIDLTGMKVIVLTGSQDKLKPEKYATVMQFWTKYFQDNNATLLDYSTGSLARLEAEISKR